MNLILKLKSSDAQRINYTFIAHLFVSNSVRYISAKYYLDWFSFHIVILKVIGVNFFLKHSVLSTTVVYLVLLLLLLKY